MISWTSGVGLLALLLFGIWQSALAPAGPAAAPAGSFLDQPTQAPQSTSAAAPAQPPKPTSAAVTAPMPATQPTESIQPLEPTPAAQPTAAPVALDALSPSPGIDFADLQSLLVNASGPIVYKTAQAALFLSTEIETDAALLFASKTVSLSDNSGLSVGISTDQLYSKMLTAGDASSQEPSFLSPVMNGTAALPSALQPIEDLISGTNGVSLDAVISSITKGANPARIVTTGYGAGGAMAQLAAIWAAVSWTQTQIRCITFGAPPVMNARAGFAFQQFVDLSYVWAYDESALKNIVLRTTDNNASSIVDGKYTMDDYVQAIIAAGAYAQSNGASGTSPGISFEEVDTGAAQPIFNGVLGAIPGTISDFGGNASPEPADDYPNQAEIATLLNAAAPEQDQGCPLVLCKIQAAVVAACGDKPVPNSTTSFVPTQLALPSSQYVITNPYDTHVVIDWDATTRTALFIWRGSIAVTDWLQDTKMLLEDGSYLLSPAIAGIFPGVETHLGFNEQFREVTDEAANSSVNIGDIMATKMKGYQPEKVLCAGHSLGASLAALCGVWASNQYPSTDVLTLALGQPFTGNQAWVDLFGMTVGREYRIIHQYDLVPQLPPTDDYRAVGLGIWLLNGQLELTERPQFDLDSLTWHDHSCWKYSSTMKNVTSITILPDATANVAIPQADGSSSTD